MVVAFAIGGAVSFALFSRESKQQFVNPEQFRTPQLKPNQTLQPSFDPGVIAGTKPFQASPNASAAKALEASLGTAVTGKSALTGGSAKPKPNKPRQQGAAQSGQPAQQSAAQPKPKKPSLSDIRDELM